MKSRINEGQMHAFLKPLLVMLFDVVIGFFMRACLVQNSFYETYIGFV